MLVADVKLIGEAGIGEQQHGSLLVLQQGVGGHGGPEPDTADQASRNHRISRATHQVDHGLHRRIARLS